VRDITREKHRDAELRRFRGAMDVSGDGIALVDRASMRYVDVNDTLCKLVGRRREELIGMTPMEVFGVERKALESDYDAIIADSASSASKHENAYEGEAGVQI